MRNNKLIIGLLGVLMLLAFVVGGSYAYFNPVIIGNDTASTQVMRSGAIEITYAGTNSIDISDFEPGESTTYEFTVKNTGLVAQSSYEVSFSDIVNEFSNNEIVYTLACEADAGICSGKTQTVVPKLPGLIITGSSIDPGVTHAYTLTVSLLETGSNQDYNKNQTLSFYIHVNQTQVYPVLKSRGGGGGFWDYASTITSITFDISTTPPAGTITAQGNIDNPNNGRIKWYLVGTNAYIYGDSMMVASASTAYQFYQFTNLVSINNLHYLNTSNVTDTNRMFAYCSSLVSLDLGSFDLSNATALDYMFYDNSSLETLRLDKAVFTSATSYYGMFHHLRNVPADKGNIYVKDQAARDFIYDQLVAATEDRHLNNNIIIVP